MTTKRKRKIGASSKEWWAKMTPEERSAEMRRRAALGRRRKQQDIHHAQKEAGHARERSSTQDISNHVAYCYGRTDAFLDFYASGAGVPRAALAAGVAELLRGATLR